MAIIIGTNSDNNRIGTNNDDLILGLGGDDTLSGGNGNDKVLGGNGNDSIIGGAGNDWIFGGSGNDTLVGGSGADQLTGGSGQDHFVYLQATDSPVAGSWDRILDFTRGQDKIDLSAFRNSSSDLDLIWKGEDPAVPGAWAVWYHNGPTSTCVYADTSGDGIADLKIELKNTCGLNLVASDFIGVSEAQVNDAPVAVADTLAATEDTPVTYTAAQLLGNDDDGDPELVQTLTIASVTSGTGGAAVLNVDGTVTFTPDANFNGAANFTYTVSDGLATSTAATVTVNVAAVNDAPVATDDVLTNVAEDSGARTITFAALTGNDSDGDPEVAQTLTITAVSNAVGGNVAIVGGQLEFTPTADFNGTASFDYAVQDNGQTNGADDFKTDTGSVSFAVTAVNDAPVAVADTLAATEDTQVTYTAAQLLSNDNDGDPELTQALTIASVTSGTDGTAVLNLDGTVTFTPDVNFNGAANFTYTVSDGVATSTAATVTVNVAAVSDAPAVAGLVVTETSISFVASDVDNEALSLTSPFADAFGNPTITRDDITVLAPAQQTPAVSGTLQVTDGTTTADVVGLYLGTSGNDFAIAPLAGSPNAMYGFGGNDSMTGGTGADSLFGGAGNDTIKGGAGNDTLAGGLGIDTLSYEDSPTRVIVNMFNTSSITVGGITVDPGHAFDGFTLFPIPFPAPTDTISNFETVIGSAFSDYIQGSTNVANVLIGGAGNDTLAGSGASDGIMPLALGAADDELLGGAGDDVLRQTRGNDSIYGGTGFDRLEFINNGIAYGGGYGVNVNLGTGTSDADAGGVDSVNGAGGDVATVSSIEFVVGTSGNDVFTGGDPLHAPVFETGQVEFFQPLGGDDTITGKAGRGWNTGVDYSTSTAPVTVVLGNSNNIGTASDGFGGTDTLIDVDLVRGGAGNDSLTGGSYSQGASGTFVEAFRGNAGNDTIDGGGSDTVIGAHGVTDRAEYNSSPFAVVVNLGTDTISGNYYGTGVITVNGGTALDGFDSDFLTPGVQPYTDTLIDINVVRGSNSSDTMVGGNAAFDNNQRFEGLGGNDLIDGGGGNDETDYSSSTTGVVVNLGTGTAFDGFGGVDTLVSVEWARGGGFNDTLVGGANALERLMGGIGNDFIDGGSMTGVNYAAFQIAGTAASAFIENGTGIAFNDGQGGTDTLVNINGLWGSNFNDTLTGGLGDQWFRGGGGSDTIDGGGNTDTVSYASDPNGVTVNLANGMATDGWGGIRGLQGTDTLTNIENVDGSDYNDRIIGDFNANRLDGGAGNDTLRGSGGNDTIDGGAGIDRLDFSSASAGISFTLNQGTNPGDPVNGLWSTGALPGGIGTDSYKNMEGVIGTNFNDTLNGSGGNDAIDGRSGDDTLQGGAGDDTIDGGAGSNDGIVFSGATAGINFTLVQSSSDTVVDLNAVGLGTDTYRNIEGVVGTSFNDTLTGSGADDRLQGGAGDDAIDGGVGGNDRIAFSDASGAINFTLVQSSSDTVVDLSAVGLGTDTYRNIEGVVGTNFNDTLTGSSGNDFIAGVNGNDLIDGADGNDTLRGSGGNDSMDGGTGIDSLDYSNATAGITFTLNQGTNPGDLVNGLWSTGALPGGIGTDFYKNMEGVIGTGFNDTLTGSAFSDLLEGGGGNDLLRQTLGHDAIDGGADFDTLSFNTGIAYGGATGVNVNLAGVSDADPFNNPGVNTAAVSSIEFVVGTSGNDVFTGGDPEHAPGFESGQTEFFQPLGGADTIAGMAGRGWSAAVDYSSNSSLQPVSVVLGDSNNIGTASADGFGFTDNLIEVDYVRGGAGDDSLVGGSYAQGASGVFVEAFRGNAGNDTIDGGGSDTVIGAYGVTDRVEYNTSPGPVIVNLGTAPIVVGVETVAGGTARDGFGFTDTLIDINVVRGSNSNDTLVGGNPKFDNHERFEGLSGNDFIDGGSGNDEADYSSSTAGVLVNLGTGTASDSFGGTDTLVSVEWARGSDFNDTLIGGANALERFTGGLGNDSIDGGSMTGVNYASFVLGTSGASASIANGVGMAFNDGQGGTDTLVNINGLWGTNFADTLTGGTGDQWFVGQGGNDAIDGGADTDTVSYMADPNGVTVNLALGTATDGWGGIWGLQGTDALSNIENIEGSSFNDTLIGDAGANIINGAAGNDTIKGGAGADVLAGGTGTDTLLYDDSPTRVIVNMFTTTTVTIGGVSVTPGTASDGFGNTDTISGFENVIGSAFNDYIQGLSNVANRFEGGAGNDTLAGSFTGDSVAGLMDDTLLGGLGDDVLRQTRGHDSIEGGEGFDRLEFVGNGIPYGGGVGVSVNLGTGTSDADPFNGDAVNGPGGDVATVSGIEHVLGTAGTDSLTGDAFANLLESGAGDDTLQGGAGNDTLDGGASGAGGGNRISFSDVTGGIGINFTLVQSSSDTVVDLSSLGLGTDTYRNIEGVIGTNFNDSLTGGSADDRLQGGPGDDTIDGGAGSNDRIAFSEATEAINFTLNQGINSGDPDGLWSTGALPGIGTDFYKNMEGVIGTNFNDTLTGSSGDDYLFGVGGDDSLNGADGNDALRGSGGNDTMDGGTGIDRLDYSNTTTGITFTLNQGTNPGDPVNGLWSTGALPGGIGTDFYKNIEGVIGTGFNDILNGSLGDDVIDGGAGDDTLRGGAGDDTLDGGAGSNDGIVFSDATGGINFTLVQSSSDTVVDLSTVGLGTDTYRNIEGVVGTSFTDTLTGSSADDRLQGGAGNDTIDGGVGSFDRIGFSDASGAINFTLVQSSSDTVVDLTAVGLGIDTYRNIEGVVGTNFNDTLTGSSGNDYLLGSGGNDSINGADGNDTLRGSGGNDTLDGGAGIDRIDFSNATGGVTFILNQGINPADPVNGLWNSGALAGIGTDFYKNIEGVIGTDFTDTLTGSSLADVLQGGGGTDTMTGLAGSDTFVFNATSDSDDALGFSDVITDFVHGTDKIDLSTIDANTGMDFDQAFAFVAAASENTVANSVTWSEDVANSRTVLQIDNDGDTTADMHIVLQGTGLGLSDSDFIL